MLTTGLLLTGWLSIGKSAGAGYFLVARQVERLAALAAIDFATIGSGANVVAIFIPALQVTAADVVVLPGFIAGALTGNALFQLGPVLEGPDKIWIRRFFGRGFFGFRGGFLFSHGGDAGDMGTGVQPVKRV